jgi:hypothetical protein
MPFISTLKPYLIGIAALALLAVVIGYGNMRYAAGYQHGMVLAEKAMRRAAEAEADSASMAKTLRSIDDQFAADKAKLDRLRAESASASTKAQEATLVAERDAAAWRQRFDAASATPSCKALMETPLCGVTSF